MLNQNFEKPLGKIVSGLYILTVEYNQHRTGLLTSFVIQTGFKPPSLGLAIKTDRYIYELIKKSGKFVLNIVGENQKELLKHFAKGFKTGEDAFAGIKIKKINETGIILESSIGYLELEMTGEYKLKDHIMIFSTIVDGEELDANTRPWVHIRKNGMHY